MSSESSCPSENDVDDAAAPVSITTPDELKSPSPIINRLRPRLRPKRQPLDLVTIILCIHRCWVHPQYYRIAKNFRGRKILRISRFCESFLREIWGVASFGAAKESNPRKFSSRKSYFSPISESFLPRNFPATRQPSARCYPACHAFVHKSLSK